MTVFEPAAGDGALATVLGDWFSEVITADIVHHGFDLDAVDDFTNPTFTPSADWLITNPPFKLFDRFAEEAISRYKNVALLGRVQALEGKRRYKVVWKNTPFTYMLAFINRVNMSKTLNSSAIAFSWFIWIKKFGPLRQVDWIWAKD